MIRYKLDMNLDWHPAQEWIGTVFVGKFVRFPYLKTEPEDRR